jgi:hypothetical protein
MIPGQLQELAHALFRRLHFHTDGELPKEFQEADALCNADTLSAFRYEKDVHHLQGPDGRHKGGGVGQGVQGGVGESVVLIQEAPCHDNGVIHYEVAAHSASPFIDHVPKGEPAQRVAPSKGS